MLQGENTLHRILWHAYLCDLAQLCHLRRMDLVSVRNERVIAVVNALFRVKEPAFDVL